MYSFLLRPVVRQADMKRDVQDIIETIQLTPATIAALALLAVIALVCFIIANRLVWALRRYRVDIGPGDSPWNGKWVFRNLNAFLLSNYRPEARREYWKMVVLYFVGNAALTGIFAVIAMS
jgi:hypothetical protein